MRAEDLRSAVQADYGALDVDVLGEDAFRVLIPSPRDAHDSVVVGVQREGDEWLITDGGQLVYLLEDEFDRVVDVMQCSGAPFSVGPNSHVLTRVAESEVPATVLSFAHYFIATPTVWHALECAKRPPPAPVSVDIMARETRTRVVEQLGERVASWVHVKYRVRAHGEVVTAPLAVGVKLGPSRPPLLVSSFIDTASPARSVTAAKHNALFTLNVVRDLRIPKFLVVRGGDQALEHYSDLYDPMNAHVVSSERLDPLYDDVREVVSEFVQL